MVAGEGEGLVGGPQAGHDRELLLQQVEADADRFGVRDAVRGVLGVEPAASQAQLDPSARHLVDLSHRDGERAGQPERHGRDQRAEADGGGVTRQPGERDPCVGRAGQRRAVTHAQVVVRPEEGVEARLLGDQRDRKEVVIAGALLGFGEDAEQHGAQPTTRRRHQFRPARACGMAPLAGQNR